MGFHITTTAAICRLRTEKSYSQLILSSCIFVEYFTFMGGGAVAAASRIARMLEECHSGFGRSGGGGVASRWDEFSVCGSAPSTAPSIA